MQALFERIIEVLAFLRIQEANLSQISEAVASILEELSEQDEIDLEAALEHAKSVIETSTNGQATAGYTTGKKQDGTLH